MSTAARRQDPQAGQPGHDLRVTQLKLELARDFAQGDREFRGILEALRRIARQRFAQRAFHDRRELGGVTVEHAQVGFVDVGQDLEFVLPRK